jgi:hypothetical protein
VGKTCQGCVAHRTRHGLDVIGGPSRAAEGSTGLYVALQQPCHAGELPSKLVKNKAGLPTVLVEPGDRREVRRVDSQERTTDRIGPRW